MMVGREGPLGAFFLTFENLEYQAENREPANARLGNSSPTYGEQDPLSGMFPFARVAAPRTLKA